MERYALIAVALVAPLLMGTQPDNPAKFVARASTLSPTPIPAASVQPVVKETVVYAESSVPNTNSAVRPSDGLTQQGGLTGSIGYARGGGNCVNEPGVHKAGGNPISWSVLFSSPQIGATVLFTWNHTGVVTGYWSNGDVEVRHQNCPGCPHRYSPGLIRGYR